MTWKYALLIVVACVFLAPVVWMASASLKRNTDVLSFPPRLIPSHFNWHNYVRVFEYQPFAHQYLNSVTVMVLVCAITVIVSVMAGYAFARVRLRGSGIVFIVLLSGVFIPPEATIVPLYRMASSLGWIDSLVPLVVFTTFITTAPIATFIMRQAFLSLPYEYGEAAIMDGAGRWRILLQVYLPMVTPSVSAVVVLSAWNSWNQFLEPLIYLRSSTNFTVPLALTHFDDPFQGPLWAVQMAAATLSVLPVLAVFVFAQKQVVSGLAAGGLKS